MVQGTGFSWRQDALARGSETPPGGEEHLPDSGVDEGVSACFGGRPRRSTRSGARQPRGFSIGSNRSGNPKSSSKISRPGDEAGFSPSWGVSEACAGLAGVIESVLVAAMARVASAMFARFIVHCFPLRIRGPMLLESIRARSEARGDLPRGDTPRRGDSSRSRSRPKWDVEQFGKRHKGIEGWIGGR